MSTDLGYDRADVPPAEEPDRPFDVAETDQYQDELNELRRQRNAGELVVEGAAGDFPPTRYERS